MTTKLRFGLVGAGAIAQSYIQAFQSTEIAQLVAIADVDLARAEDLAAKIGAQSFDSHEAMLNDLEIDAAIVCTPPITHLQVCQHLLDRKIHVLCEKPLSVNSMDAKLMIESAERSGVILTMASKFRYVEDVIRAKQIVSSGILGEIVLFENAFTGRVDMSKRWNSQPQISGGGVLIDNGTHSVDIMCYFLGALSEIQVVEGKRIQGLKVEDTVQIFVKSATGVRGNIDLSWSINKELDSYIRIYGSQGTISVGWKESKYRQASSSDWIVFGNGYNKVQAFRSQIENFTKAIKGEESLLITAADGLASVEVIESAYAAMLHTSWTPISQNNHSGSRSQVPVAA